MEKFSIPPLHVLIYAVDFLMNEYGKRKHLLEMKSVFKSYIKIDLGNTDKKLSKNAIRLNYEDKK